MPGLLYTWGSSDSGVLGLGQFITSGPLHTPTQAERVRCGANSTAVVCGQGAARPQAVVLKWGASMDKRLINCALLHG
ncbi:rps2 [Symbiodinium natans]|uniref:Rps2 protein n=1 Tax=Symbiodinium natans TaxID=878477 RepID=A0A812IHB0_9DINO|nr:rps2 [Symbiodinium natans]